MTDLKALAEAAKIQPHLGHHAEKLRDTAIDAFRSAATPDAILALYAERDEAIRRGENQFAVWVKCDVERRESVARAEAAEVSLASYKEEVERLKGALDLIAKMAGNVVFNGKQSQISHEDHMRAWADIEATAIRARGER